VHTCGVEAERWRHVPWILVLVLALDTSSAAVSVAVADVSQTGEIEQSSARTVESRGHGELLAPTIADCLAEVDAGRTAADLGAIVAGLGPGPFTGLRVGLVTAAALADALMIPVYGVCSLDGLAHAAGGELLVATDARRKEVYWARYRDGQRVAGPDVAKPADVPIDGIAAMTGAGARLYADVLGLPLLDVDHADPARLVVSAIDRIVGSAPSETLVPLYLRRPDAVPPASMSAVRQ
jgi:tRNA threonylcarbamoyl adenosine modification protein YeaZ